MGWEGVCEETHRLPEEGPQGICAGVRGGYGGYICAVSSGGSGADSERAFLGHGMEGDAGWIAARCEGCGMWDLGNGILYAARPLMGHVVGGGGGVGQPERLEGGGGAREGFEGRQCDNKAREKVQGEEEGREVWLSVGENWSSRPAGWFFEGITCAALAGRAPAGWRGPGTDGMPNDVTVNWPWSEEARAERLGDMQEAEWLS